MRVLHLLDALDRGGVQMLELDICRNAGSKGLELTFVAAGGGEMESDFRHSGVEYIRLQRKSAVDLSLALRLRKIIQERQIQVVHGHQAVEGLHTYLATVGTDVKRVLSFHGGIALDAKNRRALKFLIPRMDANIAVSNEFLNYLSAEQGLDTGKVFSVLPNGVDGKRLQSSSRTLRTELRLAKDELLLGMVANFYPEPRKDQITVCRAFPKVLEQNGHVHLAFVGAVPEPAPQTYTDCVSYCREHAIANRVHFLGARADIADVFNSLDVFVLSSLHEGLPIAVIEAFMLGLPTVVSDIPPMLEVTQNGAFALTFRPGDATELADRLVQLVTDPGFRRRLGAKAKQWALQEFAIENYILRLVSLYEELCAKTK
jgi:glycosyltransferase involved in cell wall biosynthesis